MNSPHSRFNLILFFFLCACLGCNSTPKDETEKKTPEKSKQAALLRFHLEVNPDPNGHTMEVSIGRSRLDKVIINTMPVLDEGFIKKVEMVDTDELGGYAIKVTFDDAGKRRLDSISVEHRSSRLAINATWTENRWLAAPVLNKRISNGVFVFTPDATREETERIVNGLQNVAKKVHENFTF